MASSCCIEAVRAHTSQQQMADQVKTLLLPERRSATVMYRIPPIMPYMPVRETTRHSANNTRVTMRYLFYLTISILSSAKAGW